GVGLRAISSSARSIEISWKTGVTPPVGSGRAETARSSTKRTAKLFSWKSSVRLPMVFGPGVRNQRSRRSLNLSASTGAVSIGALSRHFFFFFFLHFFLADSAERLL